ncbi:MULTISPECIES: hypothetical protein [unclassified Rhizobium]|uniref:hypothetical protein n=1 Tax=unclassified Rhizobium TaxID=2613769 RepID=UPI0007E93E5C|nr:MULTISPECIES: hypothetical protein [unclassified Rhizobium]ANL12027.1 hypothetical protein AMJ98_PA00081 [Rhizobium sp. N1341]ANM42872.1 hypothetical protein AMK03_PA00081 [Rhizobium sp. N741]
MSDNASRAVVLGFFAIVATPILAGGYFEHALQQKAVVEVQERNFARSCQTYKEMTTWERWSTPLGWRDSWCDDYLARM